LTSSLRPSPPLPPRIEADADYWPVLRRLLAAGQLEAAGELLLEHPAYAAEAGGGLQVRASGAGFWG
jgi:hypothetical protein